MIPGFLLCGIAANEEALVHGSRQFKAMIYQ
jgi:hypothetical protein